MEALLTSLFMVAVAEFGDKTQLLSFVLAARLRKPWPIIGGILAATLANHALAASVGSLLARWVTPAILSWIVGLSFIGFGLWTLHPDSLDDAPQSRRAGAFVTTFVAFFLAEMGDKTQFATIALAARYDAFASVVVGTTLGMMLVNAPSVWFGETIVRRISMRWVRLLAASLFIIMGLLTIWNPFGVAP